MTAPIPLELCPRPARGPFARLRRAARARAFADAHRARGPVARPRHPRWSAEAVGLLLLLAALAAPGLRAQSAYRNPVLARPQGVADPFILKWNGEYYLYATGDPILAYHSTDLVHWDEIGPVLSSSKALGAWNQADVWAPEVVYRNGRFYLYYTASKASPDWRVGEYARRVGVAVSESPRGPFVDVGHPVTPYWTIDGDVFREPDSTAAGPAGAEYLFASYLDEARWHGAGITADRLVAPDRAAGSPVLVTRGSEAWEDKDGDPNNGSLRYTNEAPTVFKRHGRYYMFYSGGSWDLPTYAMGYAWSDALPRGGLAGPGWTKVVPPILRSTPLVDAPGHNTLTFAPNDVDYITGYHARVVPFVGPGDRQTFLDRVYWNHDRPFMDQPTLGTLAAPPLPLFRDLFDRADGGLGGSWTVRAGTWRLSGAAAHASADALAVPHLDGGLAFFVLEANVRMPATAGAGAAGVAVLYEKAGDRVEVWLDRGRRALVTGGQTGAGVLPERATPLPADFRFDAWHQLLVSRNGAELGVDIDGVHAQRRAVPPGPASAALATRGSEAAFDGIALTPHYEDTFERPGAPASAGWDLARPWALADGALRQDARGGLRIAMKGDRAADYEFTASVRLLEGDSASQVGIVAGHDDEHAVIAGFDHTIWPFARFHVRYDAIVGPAQALASRSLAVDMPRGFRYDEYHSIRVLKRGSDFTFWLDGQEITAVRFPVGEARPGLYTDDARADFDDVAMTRVVAPRNLLLDGSFEAERWQLGTGTPEPPWRLGGKAQVSQCCGHSGVRRLLLTAADATATQVVRWLEPGAYTLEAWVSTRDAEAAVSATPGKAARVDGSPEPAVTDAGGAPARATGGSEGWRRLTLDFEVPQGYNAATIVLSGKLAAPGGFVAFDDVYLQKR